MQLKQKMVKHAVLFAAPIVTSTAIAASPTLAFGIAESSALLNLYADKIAYNPAADIASQSLAIAPFGLAEAFGTAESAVASTPIGTLGFLGSLSGAGGNGPLYQGIARNASYAISSFFLQPGETLQIGFQALSSAASLVTNPFGETASATSNVFFGLVGASTGTLYNAFGISSHTNNNGSYLGFQSIGNTFYQGIGTLGSVGPLQFSGGGAFGAAFHTSSVAEQVDLVAYTGTEACVASGSNPCTEVPEPTTMGSLMAGLFGLGAWFKRRKLSKTASVSA